MSPTARSLKYLRENGWIVDRAEYWNSFSRVRKDLFGYIDLVALAPGIILAVQVTTKANMRARIKKIQGLKAHDAWLAGGGKIVVHGWFKKANRWQLKSEEVL